MRQKGMQGVDVLEDHLVPEEVLQSPEGSCCEPWFRAEVADVVMQFSTEE